METWTALWYSRILVITALSLSLVSAALLAVAPSVSAATPHHAHAAAHSGKGSVSGAHHSPKSQVANAAHLVNAAFISPLAVQKGHAYTAWVVEKNLGAAAGGHWVTIYISKTAVRDSSSVVAGQVYVSGLAAGSVKVLKLPITVPGSYSAGLMHFVSFVDSHKSVSKSSLNSERSYPVHVIG